MFWVVQWTAQWIVLGILFSPNGYSEESRFESSIPKIYETTIIESATFDVLVEDFIVPRKKVPLQSGQPTLLRQISKVSPFSTVDYGVPSGGLGILTGGRSADETQVTALGVPLNLPQGGGADLSQFPSFLFSRASLSSGYLNTGSHPETVSGSLQLVLRTQDQLLTDRLTSSDSQYEVTGSYDRQIQSFSLNTLYPNTSVVVGSQFGLWSGPAGSLSHRFFSSGSQHLKLHVLGSSLEGPSPGPVTSPDPTAEKVTWRIIPVLEYGLLLNEQWSFQLTAYSDLSRFKILNSQSSGNSDTETQQYGLESTLTFKESASQKYQILFASRFVNFSSKNFAGKSETPTRAAVLYTHQFESGWELKPEVQAQFLNSSYPITLGGSLGAKWRKNFHEWFAKWDVIPKMPSLQNRYFVLPTFSGNPSLQPERIQKIQLGHRFEEKTWTQTLSAKGEYRTELQVLNGTTMTNLGSGHAMGAGHDIQVEFLENFEFSNSTSLLWSKIHKSTFHSGFSLTEYPNIPHVSARTQLGYKVWDNMNFLFRMISQGNALSSFGNKTPSFSLFDLECSGSFFGNSYGNFVLGLENIFDRRAQFIEGYPIAGRLVTLSWKLTL